MAFFKGAASEGNRAANLLKKREKDREELEKMKQKISEDIGAKSIFESNEKFSTHFDIVEEELRTSTIGLMTLEEMKMKRELLIQERKKKLAAAVSEENKQDSLDGKKGEKRKLKAKPVLSFDVEEDEDEEREEEEEEEQVEKEEAPPTFKRKKYSHFGKNPTVDTSFLPDRDREEEEKYERECLRQEWVEQQNELKNEVIQITYSFWDGSGHRRHVQMKKGNTIHEFLQKCLENLRKEFKELRGASVDGLMYIKEDLIIPHHYSFYDFIINKARGKSGSLFSFDVHEDIRLVNDAGIEKDESHAGKVVLRSWYERNKHIFPASRWEPYDPEKKWDKYTISDKSAGQ
ncbi:PREDICTED: protein FAM50A-like [Amphimedon queenslandica]|uniref:FAM50A/XAP5 C-terminal domain-containing protein n=1 Tax=Amphimedon queenslandica TaxID=400682 RepID=A0A1X7VBP8_AMPQE|nr:PREDICTED: protein FAM50A-like [Amphimedon queenslandica]|eukprot:XP_003384969.1 PREDICTED: protein FAM50A-like [Amphimedon queenslandica]